MTDKAIIQGSLIEFKNVHTHKCVRLLIDVPAELAPKVMEAFGWPTMVAPVPVAIARLQEPAKQKDVDYGAEFDAEMKKPEKAKRSWGELSRAEQAGIACNDIDFQRWLEIHVDAPGEDTADRVRLLCGIQSRAELDKDRAAAMLWDGLYSDYQLHRRGAAA
jgi:hypothetical protein